MQIPELQVLNVVKPPLPALAHREEVVKAVGSNRVTILSGETGSGKTTQVPQFLIDEPGLVPEGMCVTVTQPRRIACMTIAERVAQERGERLGESVGYQIRFVNNTTDSTRLIFCTTAVLLRKLHSDPHFDQVAVLVVDEVHERDVYTEFLLMAVRERMMRGEMKLKLVLMSATLSSDLFINFFSELRQATLEDEGPDEDPQSQVKIEGRMYPVKEFFLEDAIEWTGYEFPGAEKVQPGTVQKYGRWLQEAKGRQYSEATLRSMAVAGEKDVHQALMKELVSLFHSHALKSGDGGRSGILVFLPGWADISGLYHRLQGEPGLCPLMLHSQLSPDDQQRVFEDAPDGKRKVVLSTNIAETSVTIDDIVFVINSGVIKERVFDAHRQLGALDTSLNTWANATQRKGRAGRTQEGIVVHLFPQWKMAELRKWPTPEILSKSLEEVVLQLLALGLGDPHDALAKSLSTPSVACVEHAVWLLQEMGMMSQQEGLSTSEALLPLGRWVAPIPMHPMSSKALLYGALFGVLLPVTAMVAFLNIKSPFVQPAAGVMIRGGKHLIVGDSHSDHYAMAAAYLSWRSRCCVGEGDSYIDDNGLSREVLEQGNQLVKSLLRMMADEYEYDGDDASFVDDADSGSWTPEAVFDNPRTWALCKAALCAAFVPQFVHCNIAGKFETVSNEEVNGHGSSCNQSYRPMGNPAAGPPIDDWVVYSDSMKLARVSIMESTAVSAPYVLLFSRSVQATPGTKGGLVDFDGWRGTLAGGDAGLRFLQEMRQGLEQYVSMVVEAQSARMLDSGTLDDLANALADRRLALRMVTGMREQRISPKEAATMWVGNIPDEADADQVRELFSRCGQVEEVSLATDRDSGRRRAFGHVTMVTREDAEAAAQRLAGAQLYSKKLRIDLRSLGNPKGKGKGAATVVIATPPPKRRWVVEPTDEERRSVQDSMKFKAAEAERRAASKRWSRSKPDGAEGAEPLQEAEASKGQQQPATGLTPCKQEEMVEQLWQRRRVAGLQEDEPASSSAAAEPKEEPAAAAAAAAAGAAAGSYLQARSSSAGAAGGGGGAAEIEERWSALLLEAARIRVGKRKAVDCEDFVEAGRLKKREGEVKKELEEVQQSASSGGSRAQQRLQLEEAKRRAVESEDFEEAGRLKKRLKTLEEEDTGADAGEFPRWALEGALALASLDEDADLLVEELQREGQGVLPKAEEAAGHPAMQEARQMMEVDAFLRGEEQEARRRQQVEEVRQKSQSFLKVKEEQLQQTPSSGSTRPQSLAEVKEETFLECSVPGFTVQKLLGTSNQDLWQHAWSVTWQKADAVGVASDQAAVYAQAQKTWKVWLNERDRLGKEQAAADERRQAEEVRRRLKPADELEPATASAPAAGAGAGGLTSDLLQAQEEAFRESEGAQADWQKVNSEVEKRRRAKEEAPRTGRDLCALVKQRCPADQPLQFERMLAVCPKGTTVGQLVQAMSKEPQEFRQNWDGSEYCVRPVNSRCVDWLPVQVTTIPQGFREDAALPEEMLSAAKTIFEERIKPVGQAADDPLAQFLTAPGRLPADTPLPFEEVLKKCPPGTKPAELIRTMSKRRDAFRQDKTGALFCVRPRAQCRDWPAVNPYLDPSKPRSGYS